jgi:hypothetical protein
MMVFEWVVWLLGGRGGMRKTKRKVRKKATVVPTEQEAAEAIRKQHRQVRRGRGYASALPSEGKLQLSRPTFTMAGQ